MKYFAHGSLKKLALYNNFDNLICSELKIKTVFKYWLGILFLRNKYCLIKLKLKF